MKQTSLVHVLFCETVGRIQWSPFHLLNHWLLSTQSDQFISVVTNAAIITNHHTISVAHQGKVKDTRLEDEERKDLKHNKRNVNCHTLLTYPTWLALRIHVFLPYICLIITQFLHLYKRQLETNGFPLKRISGKHTRWSNIDTVLNIPKSS